MKNNNNKNIRLNPLITYIDTNLNKTKIYEDNKRKSGIYRWNNLITNKSYVGSSISLSHRLSAYYSLSNINRIINKEQSVIYKALLKYGHSNFSLDILEYCELNILIKREQYYIDLLKPEYNLLKIAGSRYGHKLSDKTKKSISIALRGNKYIHNAKESRIKDVTISKTKLRLSRITPGICVKVFDKSNNNLFEFPSINSAARHLDVSNRTIRRIREGDTSYDNYYYKFEDFKIWVYNNNNELLNVLYNKQRISELYNIPCTTLSRYIKSGKIYKNKYYFRIK